MVILDVLAATQRERLLPSVKRVIPTFILMKFVKKTKVRATQSVEHTMKPLSMHQM